MCQFQGLISWKGGLIFVQICKAPPAKQKDVRGNIVVTRKWLLTLWSTSDDVTDVLSTSDDVTDVRLSLQVGYDVSIHFLAIMT